MNNDEMIAKVNEYLLSLTPEKRSFLEALKCYRGLTGAYLVDCKRWYEDNKPLLKVSPSHVLYPSAKPRPSTVDDVSRTLFTASRYASEGDLYFAIKKHGRWQRFDLTRVFVFGPGNEMPKPPRKKRKAKRVHKCYRCGTTEDVKLQADPYAYEINNDHTRHWQCGNCAHQSAQDI